MAREIGAAYSSVREWYYAYKIHDYIRFYNEERLQKRLKCLAPMIYRNQALAA
ncbi:IS3 family transposase [Wukongibacter sp. M2B1]